MLVIYMPDTGDKKKKKRRRQVLRALGYLACAPLICWAGFASLHSNWWYLTVVVETWWLWALITGLDE